MTKDFGVESWLNFKSWVPILSYKWRLYGEILLKKFMSDFKDELREQWTLQDPAGNSHVVVYNMNISDPQLTNGFYALREFYKIEEDCLFSLRYMGDSLFHFNIKDYLDKEVIYPDKEQPKSPLHPGMNDFPFDDVPQAETIEDLALPDQQNEGPNPPVIIPDINLQHELIWTHTLTKCQAKRYMLHVPKRVKQYLIQEGHQSWIFKGSSGTEVECNIIIPPSKRMKMNNHKEEVLLLPDWSKMPTEMLEQVCKLLTIPNRARFITVCKSWLSANTSKKSYHWIPDAPWLVSNDSTSTQFQVISTTDKQAFNIYKPFSPLQNTSIVGSSNGWLILRSDQSLFILNLFSKLRLDLPPIRTMSCLLCSKGDDCFGMHTPVAFTISMCPNMNPTLVAVVTYKGELGWCKVGDTTWKGYHTNDKFYTNVTFHDNKLYAVVRGGLKVNMFKYDEGVLIQVGSVVSTNPIEHIPNLPRSIRSYCMTIYLVECGGKVFVVKRFSDDTKFHTPTIDFIIFAVEENCTTPQLVKVENLDDHVLFVANLNIECLDAKYCPKFQRGSVYFTGYSENSFTTEVGMFSISDRTIHKISLTNPEMHSPSSVWMMPRFSFECDCEVCTSAPWYRPRQLRKRHTLRKTNVV